MVVWTILPSHNKAYTIHKLAHIAQSVHLNPQKKNPPKQQYQLLLTNIPTANNFYTASREREKTNSSKREKVLQIKDMNECGCYTPEMGILATVLSSIPAPEVECAMIKRLFFSFLSWIWILDSGSLKWNPAIFFPTFGRVNLESGYYVPLHYGRSVPENCPWTYVVQSNVCIVVICPLIIYLCQLITLLSLVGFRHRFLRNIHYFYSSFFSLSFQSVLFCCIKNDFYFIMR